MRRNKQSTKVAEWLSNTLLTGPYLTLCLNPRDYAAAVAHLKVKGAPPFLLSGADATVHFFEREGKLSAVVCIEVGKHSLSQIHAMLVHEAVHIWQEYLRGIRETAPGDEIEAYSIQSISQELFLEFKRRRK
jgi:hypothetical protein